MRHPAKRPRLLVPDPKTALIFALAPLPNFISSRCAAGADDFSADYSSGPTDFGHFVTSCFLVSGVALPFTLAHAGVIHSLAGWMSAIGGAVGYGTSESSLPPSYKKRRKADPVPPFVLPVITYSHFFAIQLEDY